ncbi:MAG: LCP family protein [Oscillospiraceae bacterium]|jgi:LCP family protein required for cell wall assembly|nr:LCP family protein [Oscillospiraceae bacterium]
MEKYSRRGKRQEVTNTGGGFRRLLLILVSLLGIGILVLAVWYWVGFKPKQPDIPALGEGDDDGVAFHSPQYNPDDAAFDETDKAPDGVTESDRKEEFYTLLIIGTDGGVNTDTIMLASYDNIHKKANLISIPRDTLVNVKRPTKKINAAYPSGASNGGGKEGGIAQLKREVKTLIGFIPDFSVLIDMKAFVQIIDALGGVEVDVPFHMVYNDPTQKLSINIPKGLQTLNGTDAMKFARYRRGSSGSKTISDYDRINHQQAVIKAILDKALKPASLLKIPQFISIFSENVTTDLKTNELLWFAQQLNGLQGTDALSTYTIPIAGTSGSPKWYEYADAAKTADLVNATINPYNVPITAENLDVINAVP